MIRETFFCSSTQQASCQLPCLHVNVSVAKPIVCDQDIDFRRAQRPLLILPHLQLAPSRLAAVAQLLGDACCSCTLLLLLLLRLLSWLRLALCIADSHHHCVSSPAALSACGRAITESSTAAAGASPKAAASCWPQQTCHWNRRLTRRSQQHAVRPYVRCSVSSWKVHACVAGVMAWMANTMDNPHLTVLSFSLAKTFFTFN